MALIGPNGCGKSSVFDAFEERLKDVKNAPREPESYFTKFAFHPAAERRTTAYNRHAAIQITFAGEAQAITPKSFHLRSAYRYTPWLDAQSITAQPDLVQDAARPSSAIAMDSRMRENYERLLGIAWAEFDAGIKTANQVRAELLGTINAVLGRILDVRVSSMGNVIERRGQLYFAKDDATDFPYRNLSSGEKEVIDLIVDLVVRREVFNDTIYGIDEPELHLNTAVQRKLLVAIDELIPPNCQLWIATHSIGFLRALQADLGARAAILDFSERDFFVGSHTIRPMSPSRTNWQRAFGTALDDIVGLLAPERIVYCEGRPQPTPEGIEQGFDAQIYNEVFALDRPGTLFVSSGGTNEVKTYGSVALKVLAKAFVGVELLLLRDRDQLSDNDRDTWLSEAAHHRMLPRREIENYLFDFDVVQSLARSRDCDLDRAAYDEIVTDIAHQDLKPTVQRLMRLCRHEGSAVEFRRALASHVRGTEAFRELSTAIWPS